MTLPPPWEPDPSLDLIDDGSFVKLTRSEISWDQTVTGPPVGERWTTFDAVPVAGRGPTPWPDWLVTDGDAGDTDLGILKTGKEAEVFLVERASLQKSCLLAAKRYRTREHRLFTRDSDYQAGRVVRKTRERRAMANRTDFGRRLLQRQWADDEWTMLVDLYRSGLPVPYPVSWDGREILMEFIGDADGTAAPRLAQAQPGTAQLVSIYEQVRDVVLHLAERGQAHGDLSQYNILLHGDRVVVIDWPQVVDVVANPSGMDYLMRDVTTVAAWFGSHGLDVDADKLFAEAVALV